ncbi:MAG TPA: ATP-dependent DNA helicase [Ilumatobacteraceae bacterium]|nr:ATP-dependent DNA helicase [Ilumatobacteraceae bacterium]
MSERSSAVVAALDAVTSALDGAEHRPGQRDMAERVARAVESGRHAIVQAGTGTGKTLAYLVPLVLSAQRVVVATATKALQDQLATKDLPFLDEHLPVPFEWAVLKGRSNYLCLQRLREVNESADGQLELDGMASTTKAEIKRLASWAGDSPTGDQAELDWTPSDTAWRSVSVGSDECPGADRCPLGQQCFAELARRRAGAADVIVVNTHLYGLHVASGGVILPEHDVVVFDEAHGLEDIMSDTVGVTIAPSRFIALAAVVRRIIDDPALIASVTELSELLGEAIGPLTGQRLPTPLPDQVREFLVEARTRLGRISEALTAIDTQIEDAKQRKLRAQTMTGRLIGQLEVAIRDHDGYVDFVSGSPEWPRLEIAPLDVGPTMQDEVWGSHVAILTSATIPSSLADRVGLPADATDAADVGSPFDYPSNALLYCARHLPDPRSEKFRPAVHEELAALITAAGGRTLALFTSWRAMDEAAAAVRAIVPYTILTQRDLPKPALVRAFAADAETCLFATAGLFQGVDVPGSTLSLVVIDRIPFPRPDDPLLSARRDLLGPAAFSQIDLPRAAMLLAQACGRLIRNATDRGVVAVLDPRLATARYRWDIVRALPPMRRTRHRAEAEEFLRELVSTPTALGAADD